MENLTLEELSKYTKEKTESSDVKRTVITIGSILVIVILLFWGYGKIANFFHKDTEVNIEVTNTYTTGQNIDINGYDLTVLKVEGDLTMAVDENGDVWQFTGEAKYSNAELVNLQCDSTSRLWAKWQPEETLQSCKTKVFNNSELYKRDMPELAEDGSTMCANGQRLWVTNNGGVLSYSCGD